MEIDQIVKSLTPEEATRTKNVIAGTSEFVEAPMILYDEDGLRKIPEQKHIPSLFTVVNEALMNCCDHAVSCINKRTMQHKQNPNVTQRYVDNINIKLNQNGVIVVENDGYGIPVIKLRGIYLPIVLFTEQNTGDNTDQDPYRITGGTNGCGAKVITSFSKVTLVECCDGINEFSVRIEADKNGKKTIHEPTITPCTTKSYTRVSFEIDWANTKYKKFNKGVRELFTLWLRTRCILISLYLNTYRKCTLRFNKEVYCTLYEHIKCDKVYSTSITMKIKNNKLLGYNNSMFGMCKVYISFVNSKPIRVSVINGIEVTKNPILNDIMDKLYAIIKADVLAEAKVDLTKQAFNSKLNIIFVGTIMNPQWVGQTKNGITRSNELTNMYTVDYSTAKELSQVFKEHLITKQATIIQNKLKNVAKNDKYMPAQYVSDGIKGKTTYLWLAEGDSAIGFIRSIIGMSKGRSDCKFNFSNSGMLPLGGVIINTYHRIKLHNPNDFRFIENTGKSMLVMDKKCIENVFIPTFIKEMGIKLDCQYSTEKELNSLKYTKVIIATDQDKDGYNINGLLLVLMSKWPGLFEYGRVLRMQTPVTRIKPITLTNANQHKSIEFFIDHELPIYLKTNKIPRGFHVKYYKGLSGHEREYFESIATNIDKYLYTFATSKRSIELLEVYYDKKNPDARKDELRTPVRDMTKKEINLYKKRIITISTFLQIYVKDYQLDNLNRKLLKVMDGQNNVCGKLIYACPIVMRNDELKVNILGGDIIKKTNYHHGDASIQETIFKNAQAFPGKKLYPMLQSVGNTGSRNEGGKDHGSSRYVSVKLNTKIYEAFFRKEDNILLEYLECDNQAIEPKYYYPVLPITILENYKTTAHGWKIEIWGRDLTKVKEAIGALLNGRTPTAELPINPKISTNKLIVLTTDGDDREYYSKGEYKIVQRMGKTYLNIIELPIGVWPMKYISELNEPKYATVINGNIANRSSDNNVDIEIPLIDSWLEKIPKYEDNIFSDVELFFKLRIRLCSDLNFISPEGGVLSFDRYIDFLIYWFNIRKKYYILRVKRQIEIIKNKLLDITNRYNYLKNFHDWGLGQRKSRENAHKIMLDNGLIMINTELIEPPIYIPTDKISTYVTITSIDQDPGFDELYKNGLITKYASFEYLDSIRNDKVRSENMAPLEKKIEELQYELNELIKPNKWKHIWAAEIKHLVNILQETSQF